MRYAPKRRREVEDALAEMDADYGVGDNSGDCCCGVASDSFMAGAVGTGVGDSDGWDDGELMDGVSVTATGELLAVCLLERYERTPNRIEATTPTIEIPIARCARNRVSRCHPSVCLWRSALTFSFFSTASAIANA